MAAPTPNLVLSILFTIKFIAGSPSEDLGECFCDNGCYKAKDTPFRLQCCDDICENAAERRTENLCNEHCKCYQTIKNNKVCMTFLKKERAGTSLNRAIHFAFYTMELEDQQDSETNVPLIQKFFHFVQ